MIWPDASFKKLGLLEFQNKGVTCDLINSIVQGLAWTCVQLKFDPKISEMHMELICKFKKNPDGWDYNIFAIIGMLLKTPRTLHCIWYSCNTSR